MIRRVFLPLAVAGAFVAFAGAGTRNAYAQDDDEGEMTFDTDEAEKEAPPEDPEATDTGDSADTGDAGDISGPDDLTGDLTLEGDSDKPVKGDDKDVKLGENRVAWQDIVVVVRKPFLKVSRLEILPTYAITMNDNIIQHHMFGGSLNYYLTDVLAVGIEGQYFIKNLREPFDLVARQARRLPTVNKYKYGASLNFHYVPIYGKFAVLNEHVIHWESFFTAGVGFTESEVLPRDPKYRAFDNFLITPNVGIAMRFFLTKFLTVHVGVRDYIFLDRFEATDRTEVDPDAARDGADSTLVNNVMFQAGVSFWFPTSFRYTTFR